MKKEELIGYEIYIKSFNDSNGDGIGDINGIREKLDYLNDLGINLIWITPIFISPQNDNGYDIQDYYKIDPIYGTIDEFKSLISEAKEMNIKIMMDMVLNHTSISHEWFQKAISGDKKYQDYYIFKDGEKIPTNWESKFGGNAWEFKKEINKWYLHLYDKTQADLNWKNPEVREELYKIVNFWSDMGVGGFRFDVINVISKPTKYIDDINGDGKKFYTDAPKVHAYIKELIEKISKNSKNELITVGEMSATSIKHCLNYTRESNHELMMTFNFHHLKIDYENGEKWTIKKPDIELFKKSMKDWQEGMDPDGWIAIFLSNHDQPRQLSRFGSENKYRFESATTISASYIFMRGTPYIYFGEEIGMTNANYSNISYFNDVESINAYDNLIMNGLSKELSLKIINSKSRDNGRTPMQWSNDSKKSFTSGTPWIKPSLQNKEINFEKDILSKKSIFKWYKMIILMRKNNDILKFGSIKFNNNRIGIIDYKREYKGKWIRVISNWTDEDKFIGNMDDNIIINNYDSFENKLKPYQIIILEGKPCG